jgi:Flp pilus assembly protein TadG
MPSTVAPMPQSTCRRLSDDIRGTISVEFALLAPVLFAIMFGILGFGMQYSTRIALTYAASEGGRAAVAGLSDDERESLARIAIQNTLEALSPLVDPTKAQISFQMAEDQGNTQVDISIAYNDARFAQLPFLPDFTNLAPVSVSYFVTDPSSG